MTTTPRCGCGRDATHRGRCAWRRAVSPETLAAVRAKRHQDNGHIGPGRNERVRELLVAMEEVHLACIAFAAKYSTMKRKLSRVTAAELVEADPDMDTGVAAVL